MRIKREGHQSDDYGILMYDQILKMTQKEMYENWLGELQKCLEFEFGIESFLYVIK